MHLTNENAAYTCVTENYLHFNVESNKTIGMWKSYLRVNKKYYSFINLKTAQWAVQCLRRLVIVFSSRRPGFDPRRVHVVFVVAKFSLDHTHSSITDCIKVTDSDVKQNT
jgi:hypothetical protein